MSVLHGKAPSEFLRVAAPSASEHWGAFRQELLTSGPLDAQTCELILIAGFATAGYEDLFKFHAGRLLEAGATVDTVRHAVLITLGVSTTAFQMAGAMQWLDDITD